VTALPRLPIDFDTRWRAIGVSLGDLGAEEGDASLRETLLQQWHLMNDLRAAQMEAAEASGTASRDASAVDLRDALARLALLEQAIVETAPSIRRSLGTSQFNRIFDDARVPFSANDMLRLLDTLAAELREARLALILAVAERAKAIGLDLLPDDLDAFGAEFRAAPFADTLGWQETAHLAASPANARHLMAAIAAAATDRTDDLALPAGR